MAPVAAIGERAAARVQARSPEPDARAGPVFSVPCFFAVVSEARAVLVSVFFSRLEAQEAVAEA
jgi:hypothetical protein